MGSIYDLILFHFIFSFFSLLQYSICQIFYSPISKITHSFFSFLFKLEKEQLNVVDFVKNSTNVAREIPHFYYT